MMLCDLENMYDEYCYECENEYDEIPMDFEEWHKKTFE